MRFKSLCLYLFLLTFCVFAFGSGSGSARPSLIFTSWQAGRGVKGGPSDAPNQLPIWSTFATHSETKCKLDVQVGYADRFGDSCAITNFYACDNHVHFINTALLMGACGRHWVPSRLLSAHSLQASCSTINSNGDSCTVTSFYACYNHTHTYPAP